MTPTAEDRYFARSASDRTDDWPLWFVADRARGNLNVTTQLLPELRGFSPFLSRADAEELARQSNRARAEQDQSR